jgi:hypothetical protein
MVSLYLDMVNDHQSILLAAFTANNTKVRDATQNKRTK